MALKNEKILRFQGYKFNQLLKMPLFKEFKIGDIDVAVWKITETTEELSSLVAPECAVEVAHMKSCSRRQEWLAVRVLLARLCGKDARIVYDECGKPFLVGADGFISISHTRDYVLLAHSFSAPFGVDMELSSRDASVVARKFMKEPDVASLSPETANKALLIRWCVCEALFKLVGNVGGTYKDNVLLLSPFPAPDGSLTVSLKGCRELPDSDYAARCVEEDGLVIVFLQNNF